MNRRLDHLSVAEIYHRETKYRPQTLHDLPSPAPEEMVPPIKDLHTDRALELLPYLPAAMVANPSVTSLSPGKDAETRELCRLSRLLYFTYGITGRSVWPGGQQIYRAAPSAGGLFPVELYVVTAGMAGVADGLHLYHALEHQLVPVFDGNLAPEIHEACFKDPATEDWQAAVVLTGVHGRSAWRYHERSYRRLLLDTGHVLGNLLDYGRAEGLQPAPVRHFHDARLNSLFFLTENCESVQVVVPLNNRPVVAPARRVSEFSTGSVDDTPLYLALHASSSLDEHTREHDAGVQATVDLPEPPPAPRPDSLGSIIRSRRSTRRFSGDSLSVEKLLGILTRAYAHPGGHSRADGGTRDRLTSDLLESLVIVHAIDGMTPGVYRYHSREPSLTAVVGVSPREVTQQACLGQELVRDAAAIVVHVADLTAAIDGGGDRVYRDLHIDAGVIGQRLNLEAVAEGVGVSGIGGFFDEEVNDLLALPERYAILYLTVIGEPGS